MGAIAPILYFQRKDTMKALSRKGLNYSHSEGITINFRNGIFETKKPQEIEILKKYNNIYWSIVPEINKEGNDTTEQVKVSLRSNIEVLNGKKRYELYKLAKEKGFEDNFISSTKEKLIKFINK